MDIKDFKSGTWKEQYRYKSFSPGKINHDWSVSSNELNLLLSEANIRLGELNAFSELVPDIDFFIKMHVQKEAITSSRIEGTRTNFEEAFQKVDNILPERRNDWFEVNNYVGAMSYAIGELVNIPLSSRLLRETHSILLDQARGGEKLPGEFRASQNWIGGSSIRDAAFVPPHHDEVAGLMSDLEKFLHNESIAVPDLIKIGIAHYQFETIHPFLDGNGRIGRLMITLYLVSRGILVKPTLYLSDFFEKNKADYYDKLMMCRTHKQLGHWLSFFLEGVKQTCGNSIQTFRNIINLRQKIEYGLIPGLGKKAKSATRLLHYLYGKPVIDSQEAADCLGANISTALRMIDDFRKLGIITEITGYKRNRIFVFRDYLDLFK